MPRLAFLGPPGTFGEIAALRLYPDDELVACTSHAAVAKAVAEGRAERGVVAIENSLEGSVPETLDALISEAGLSICAETALPIRHALLGHKGARGEEVRVIYSHPQALGQCRRFLERTYPDVPAEAALSTAAAIQEMLDHPGAAAIGNERAAALYGAAVLQRDIQDDPSNTTRFVVLSTADAPPSGDDKTSLVFSTADRPGALVAVLRAFAERSINLTKIESRPAKERLGVYVFLVDVEGHRLEGPVAEAIEDARRHTEYLRILGSYRRHHGSGNGG
ncbi:MAG TPA: prephenate dehydratase [Dehalococcoidia bacterium]|nr:prephenate dehydratase [Dehalococcoidia bacterium]